MPSNYKFFNLLKNSESLKGKGLKNKSWNIENMGIMLIKFWIIKKFLYKNKSHFKKYLTFKFDNYNLIC